MPQIMAYRVDIIWPIGLMALLMAGLDLDLFIEGTRDEHMMEEYLHNKQSLIYDYSIEHGMDHYCVFGTKEQVQANDGSFEERCYEQNPQVKHIQQDGTVLYPFLKYGSDGLLLKCPDNIPNGTLIKCTGLPYTSCNYTCSPGYTSTVNLTCHLVKANSNASAEWSVREPCELQALPPELQSQDVTFFAALLTVGLILILSLGVLVFLWRRVGKKSCRTQQEKQNTASRIYREGQSLITSQGGNGTAQGQGTEGQSFIPSQGSNGTAQGQATEQATEGFPETNSWINTPLGNFISREVSLNDQQFEKLVENMLKKDPLQSPSECITSVRLIFEQPETFVTALRPLIDRMVVKDGSNQGTIYGYVLEKKEELNFASAAEVELQDAIHKKEVHGGAPVFFLRRMAEHDHKIGALLEYFSKFENGPQVIKKILTIHKGCEYCQLFAEKLGRS